MERCRKNNRCESGACDICLRLYRIRLFRQTGPVLATKGFGLGARTDGEGKLGQLRKKKVNTVKSHWGSKRTQTDERAPVEHRPSYDVQDVKIADIKILGRRRALNPAKINELAESISSLGIQSPISTRLVKRDLGWGKTKTELVLVSGLHRLEAVKQLGKTTIPCVILKGGKRIARMWEISENLHRG